MHSYSGNLQLQLFFILHEFSREKSISRSKILFNSQITSQLSTDLIHIVTD